MIKPPTHPLLYAFAALLVVLWASVFGPAFGQTALPENIDSWNRVADTAERVLAVPSTGDTRLEEVRTDLVARRSEAREALEPLKARVTTLAEQLDTLGPLPEDGSAEPEAIATRRAELTAALAEARVPVVSVEAFIARADEFIEGIDAVRRERLSQTLTRRGPIPVMPGNVTQALREAQTGATSIADQTRARLAETDRSAQILSRLPVALSFLALGLVILFVVSWRLSAAIGRQLQEAQSRGHLALWGVLLDLSRTIVPIAASLMLIAGLREMNPGVPALTRLIGALQQVAIIVIVSQWVGTSLYKPLRSELAVLPGPSLQPRGHYLTIALGLVAAGMVLLDAFAAGAQLSQTSQAVLKFPLLILGALVLFPLSGVLGARPEEEAEEDAPPAPQGSVGLLTMFLSWSAFVVAIIVPLLALAGYFQAARYIFLPYVYSYLLIGAFLVVFWLFREWMESWLERGGTRAQMDFRAQFRLVPVLFGLLLTITALPLLALLWGARTSDVQSALAWLSDGVSVGDTQLSASDILVFLFVFAFGYMATRAIQSVLRNSVLPRTSADIGARTAIVSGIGYVGIFLAGLAAISATGLSLGNLAIVAGALSIGVGFGLQTIVSNFVSGIILLIERPIKLGDWIEVSGFSGYVRRISVRATEIETFDRASVILPNADLVANPVLNWTHASQQARVIVPVGVAYGTDPRKVEALLLQIAEGDSRLVRRPSPWVVFQGFGPDALDFELRGIVRDANDMLSVRSDINFEIARVFEEEGIEIPFAQRDINLRNPEAIAAAFARGLPRTER